MQGISNDKIVSSITVQNLKDFNSQNVATKAKKVEHLAFMMLAIQNLLDGWCYSRIT